MSIIGAVSLTDKTGIFLGSVNLSNLNSDANSVLYSVNGSDIKGDNNILKFEEDIKKLTVKDSMSYVSASPIGVETAINENEFFTGVLAQNKNSADGSSTHLLITNDQGTDYSFYGGFDMFSSNSTVQYGQFATMPNALGISSQSSSIILTPNAGNSENQNQNNNIMLTYDNGTKAHIINNAGQLIVGANNPNYSGDTYGGDDGGDSGKVLSTDENGLKWITPSAGITISNQANTLIPFCTSTSNSLDCSSNLSFDGTRLSLYSTNPLTIGRGNNASSAATNTAIGYQSLNAVTSGVNNTCYGYNSGVALTTQSQSTMIGSGASTTATGSNNVAVGYSSRAGSSSVSVGSAAYCTDASVSVGSSCGRAAMSGTYNVLMGFTCGNAITSGNGNVCVGSNNGFNITSGTNNTLIGISAGSTQTTQSNNTVCGYFSDVGAYSNSAIFGANITSVVNGSNQVQIGNSATTVYTYATATRASDARDKAEIRDTQFGLDFISKLRPRDYKFDYREEYQELKQIKDESGNIIGTEFIEYPRDGSKKRNRYHCGLIAQELKETMDELNTDFAGYIDFQHNDPGLNVGEFNRLTVKYDELICPLIKAVQELKLKNEQLEERIKALS